jgi:hypothetical protein
LPAINFTSVGIRAARQQYTNGIDVAPASRLHERRFARQQARIGIGACGRDFADIVESAFAAAA